MRSLGDKWRILAHAIIPDSGYPLGDPVAFSSDGDSEFDELVIGNDSDPYWFHLEQMNERDWWFAFYVDGDSRVCGNMRVFHTKPNEFNVWVEAGDSDYRLWRYPNE